MTTEVSRTAQEISTFGTPPFAVIRARSPVIIEVSNVKILPPYRAQDIPPEA